MPIHRDAKKAALLAAQHMGIAALYRSMKSCDIRILCYHGAWTSPCEFAGDSMFILPDVFARRLDLIEEHGYKVITLDEAVSILLGEAEPVENAVVITIDDGWRTTRTVFADELHKRNMPATLYCDTENFLSKQPMAHLAARYMRTIIGEEPFANAEAQEHYAGAMDLARPRAQRWESCQKLAAEIGFDLDKLMENDTFIYMTPDELREVVELGIDVQLHTHTHTLADFSLERVASEIAANRRELSALLGRPAESFTHFCYPSGLFSTDALKHLMNCGVRSATTCEMRLASDKDDILLLPRILDNGACSDVEFTAELAGISPLLRKLASSADAQRSTVEPRTPHKFSKGSGNANIIAAASRESDAENSSASFFASSQNDEASRGFVAAFRADGRSG